MLSREKHLLQKLFGAFQDTPRIYYSEKKLIYTLLISQSPCPLTSTDTPSVKIIESPLSMVQKPL